MASNPEESQVGKGYAKISGSERLRAATAKFIGPLEPDRLVSATLVLRHKPGSPPLPDHEYWASTPIGKRQFLSPAEYGDIYGAAEDDLKAVTSFTKRQGLNVVNSSAASRTVTVSGTAAQMNGAFGIQLNRYESPLRKGRKSGGASVEASPAVHVHHGYDGAVHIPSELAGIVTAIVGLDNRSMGGPGGGTGDPPNSNPLAVPDIAALYNFPNSGASEQVIGVIAPARPVGTPGQQVCGYLESDIADYFSHLADGSYKTRPTAIKDVSLTVGANTYTNETAVVRDITRANLGSDLYSFILEITQDISTAATIAQGAMVNVYFTELTEQGLLLCLNRILVPEGEKQCGVVTCSFSFFGTDDTTSIGDVSDPGSAAFQMSSLFQQLATVGIAMFMIAQDWGSNNGDPDDGKTHVNYPGSDPWVTCVGGTVVGNIRTGPPMTFDEYVWSNAGTANPIGGSQKVTGGGASENFPVPAYQVNAGINSITDSKGNVYKKRFIPDVAGMVCYYGFQANGVGYGFTGTSCSAPLFAGLYAALRQSLGVIPGFLNPTLYQLRNAVCNDVTYGNNDPDDGSNAPFFTAGQRWDPCSGWGSIDGSKLQRAIASLIAPQPSEATNAGAAVAESALDWAPRPK